MSKSDHHRKKATIFIVEDNAVVGEFIRTSLMEAGYQKVKLFVDPREAIAELKMAKRIDMVITDIYMPRVNGFVLARFLRRKPELATVPVIVVSADQSDTTREELERNGVSAVLPKPLESSELVDVVDQFLASRSDIGSKRKLKPAGRSLFGRVAMTTGN